MVGFCDYSAIGSTNSGVFPHFENRFIMEDIDDKRHISYDPSDKEAKLQTLEENLLTWMNEDTTWKNIVEIH